MGLPTHASERQMTAGVLDAFALVKTDFDDQPQRSIDAANSPDLHFQGGSTGSNPVGDTNRTAR
jgi:hypothetical protein